MRQSFRKKHNRHGRYKSPDRIPVAQGHGLCEQFIHFMAQLVFVRWIKLPATAGSRSRWVYVSPGSIGILNQQLKIQRKQAKKMELFELHLTIPELID
jgi:hypothetical protein